MRLIWMLICTALALPAGAAATPAAESYASALQRWARVLDSHVDTNGAVNFAGLARAPQDLQAFVDYIARVSPESAPEAFPTPDSRLAYHINAYNALAMYNVIDSGLPESLAGLRKIPFFVFKRFRIGGRSMSLYTYENDVIRKMGDERVHFALNCMSVGCPQLPREPFVAERLQTQLEREARRFFADPRHLQRDDAKREVRASEILDFYTEDFLRRDPDLITYINRHAPQPVPADYRVRFIDYDWTVKAQAVRR